MLFDVPLTLANRSGIYIIVNLKNDNLYVGSAANLSRRFRQHLHDLRHSSHCNSVLQRAFDKYGESSFAFALVELVPADRLVQVEQKYLDKYFDGKRHCYNISPTAQSTFGVVKSAETVERHRRSLIDYYKTHPGPRLGSRLSEETRVKIRKARFGRICHTTTHTADTKKRISEAKKGQSIKRRHYHVTFISPSGVVFENVRDVKNFARQQSLSPAGLYGLLHDKYPEYLGWKYEKARAPWPVGAEGLFELICQYPGSTKYDLAPQMYGDNTEQTRNRVAVLASLLKKLGKIELSKIGRLAQYRAV